MANRYELREVTHYEVVDTEQDGYIAINTQDRAFAEQYLLDLETNHQNLLAATENITTTTMDVADDAASVDLP